MTELEQARTHLMERQLELRDARLESVICDDGKRYPEMMIERAAAAVLAALSWVWDAQERENDGWTVLRPNLGSCVDLSEVFRIKIPSDYRA